jgi:hypothetical protein
MHQSFSTTTLGMRRRRSEDTAVQSRGVATPHISTLAIMQMSLQNVTQNSTSQQAGVHRKEEVVLPAIEFGVD